MTKKDMEFVIRCMLLVGTLVLLVAPERATATTYNVGNNLGWTVPATTLYYTNWAANKTFMVGDKLFFNWTGMHNVAEVSDSEYNNCSKANTVIGSPVTITLTGSGAKYYLCSVDSHCLSGQKLSVTVISYGSSLTPAISVPALLFTGFVLSLFFPILPFPY